MKKISLIFLLIICYSTTYINSQIVTDATIRTNGSKKEVVKIMQPNGNDFYSDKIILMKKEAIDVMNSQWVIDKTLYPDDIDGFMINKHKDVYVSKYIDSKKEKLFLQQIVNSADIKIYSLASPEERVFYTEKDDKLVEINSNLEPYKSQLINKSSECNKVNTSIFKRMQLNEVDLLNGYKTADKCNQKYLSAPFQFGIMVGYNKAVLPENKYFGREKQEDELLIFGVYANFNLDRYKNFSFRPELYYIEEDFSSYVDNGLYKPFGELKRKSLVLPLLVRYSYIQSKRIIPYVEVGPSVNFTLNDHFYLYTYSKDNEEWGRLKEEISKIYFGVSAGLGAEIPITYKYSVNVGFRYHYNYMNQFDLNNWMFTISGNIF